MTSPSYWVSPREANLLITGGCNLRCRHCSVLSHGALTKDLPLKAWEAILDELARCKLLRLTITGGEPMARADFPGFLDMVAARPFRYSVNTNGTLVTPATVQSLTRHSGRLGELMVSLDGPDSETVDCQRGRGVFDAMVEGTGRLRSAGLPFGFYCTVTSLNVKRLPETAEFALSLGAEWIKFNNFLLAGPVLSASMVPGPSEVAEGARQLAETALKHPGRITGSILEMRQRALGFLNGKRSITSGQAFSCGGGINKIAVFPDGAVTPCDHLPGFVLGNLTKNGLEEILTGGRMADFTAILKRPRALDEECSSCEYRQYCTGGCPVEAIVHRKGIGRDRSSCLKTALENLRM